MNKISPRNIRLEIISGKSHKELNEIFNAGDCLLLTSLHEGSPNIVKEAMATNLPIVSVACGDVRERLKDVENSYVIESYSSEGLAHACLKVIENDSRSNGRIKLLNQELDSDSVAIKIHNLLLSL